MKKVIIIIAITFIFCDYSFSQSIKNHFINNLRENLFSFTSSVKLKDSIALYTFAIQIDIKNKGNTFTKEVSCNDSISNIIFDKKYKSFLKGLNYKPLIGKVKKAILIIPVAYIIANYKTDDLSQKKIPLMGLSNDLYKLFNITVKDEYKTENYIYLKPLIITVDKAAYH